MLGIEKNSNLRNALFETGLTQRDLAKGTGISETHISMAIQGRYNFDSDQRSKIAAFLNKSEGELFERSTYWKTLSPCQYDT